MLKDEQPDLRLTVDEIEVVLADHSSRHDEALRREVDNLKTALLSRATIEQAKGILAGAQRCDPDSAFEILRRASQRQNRKVRDIAHDLVQATRRIGDGPEPKRRISDVLGFDSTGADHAALVELQQAMQPPVPQLLDLEVGVRYLPADQATAGGDLYDWQLLEDGSLHLAVVDVVGKGIGAVRDALTTIHALRLLAIAGTALQDLIGAADRLLSATFVDLSATAIVARYDPAEGAITIASGGHPPALLINPDGATRYLHTAGRAIGWPEAGSEDALTVRLDPGALVVLYTDGLIEAKGDIEAGLQELEALGALLAGHRADEVASTFVTRTLEDAQRFDDTLAVALLRPTDA